MLKNYEVKITKTQIRHEERKYDFYEEIIISNNNNYAMFIQHGENFIDENRFSKGQTKNKVKLWTRHDKNFKCDFQFEKIGRWGKNQSKPNEFLDMLFFIKECNNLPVIHPKNYGEITYDIVDGVVKNVLEDEYKNLIKIAYSSMEKYEESKKKNFPEYYQGILKQYADEDFKKIINNSLEKDFYNYVKLTCLGGKNKGK